MCSMLQWLVSLEMQRLVHERASTPLQDEESCRGSETETSAAPSLLPLELTQPWRTALGCESLQMLEIGIENHRLFWWMTHLGMRFLLKLLIHK